MLLGSNTKRAVAAVTARLQRAARDESTRLIEEDDGVVLARAALDALLTPAEARAALEELERISSSLALQPLTEQITQLTQV